MGDKHSCGHQNSGKTSSGKLRHSGPCSTIGVHLFAAHEKDMGQVFAVLEKVLQRIFLPHLFFGQ